MLNRLSVYKQPSKTNVFLVCFLHNFKSCICQKVDANAEVMLSEIKLLYRGVSQR